MDKKKLDFMSYFYSTFIGETYPIDLNTAEEWIVHLNKRNDFGPVPDYTPFEFMTLWNKAVCPDIID